jgi:pentapeptide MXKDX repeat protein
MKPVITAALLSVLALSTSMVFAQTNDSMSKDSAGNDSMGHSSMSHDSMKKGHHMKKADGMKKNDAMAHTASDSMAK